MMSDGGVKRKRDGFDVPPSSSTSSSTTGARGVGSVGVGAEPTKKRVIETVVAAKPAKTVTVVSASPQPSVTSSVISAAPYRPPSSIAATYDDEDAAPLPVFADGQQYQGTSSAPSYPTSVASSYGPSYAPSVPGRSTTTPSYFQQTSNMATATAAAAAAALSNQDRKTAKRAAAGEEWDDFTLLEWPDNDFRIFAGDLGPEVTDDMLRQAFARYTSFQKAKVIRDKKTGKSKGFGFISFSDPMDFARAIREMNGKYVGNRPVKLRKSRWQDRSKTD